MYVCTHVRTYIRTYVKRKHKKQKSLKHPLRLRTFNSFGLEGLYLLWLVLNRGSYYLYPLKIPDVRTFVLTFNAFGRWAPEAPIDQTLRFRLVRASGFPSPQKKSASGFPSPKKNQVFLASWTLSKFLVFWRFFGRFGRVCTFIVCTQPKQEQETAY